METKDYSIDILKLAKKYAGTHSDYCKLFGDYDDYVQELILAVLRRLSKYDSAKGSFGTFCYIIFKHRTIMEIVYYEREKRKHSEISSNISVLDKEDSGTLEDLISDNTDLASDVENKIIYDRIKEHLNEAIFLYMDGYTMNEIADKLNITHQAVSQRIAKCKRDLEVYLETGDLSNFVRRKNWGSLKEARERYCKEHNISIRTYFRRKKNNTLNEGEVK